MEKNLWYYGKNYGTMDKNVSLYLYTENYGTLNYFRKKNTMEKLW